MHIASVIVTHGRSVKLATALDRILDQSLQPTQIHVVDNASTDATPDVCARYSAQDPRIKVVRLATNIGGAGGFHAGIQTAYRSGADFVWLLDDDAFAERECLSRLVAGYQDFIGRTGRVPGFACSLVKYTDGDLNAMNVPAAVWNWPRFYDRENPVMLVKRSSFVSVLVARDAIMRHGLPIKDFFIWFDDVEYTTRLSGEHPGLLVLDSIVIHDTPDNNGIDFGQIDAANIWKFEYGIRNEAWWHRRSGGIVAYLKFVFKVVKQLGKGRVSAKLQARAVRALLRALVFRPAIDKV